MSAERRQDPNAPAAHPGAPLDEILDARLDKGLYDLLAIEAQEGSAGLEAAVEAVEALADPADDEFRHGLEELLHPKG